MLSRVLCGLVVLALSAEAGNLLKNGGFEDGLSPWGASFGSAKCVRVADRRPHGGKRCLQISCKGENAGVDYPRFQVGRTVARIGTYRLRTALRNGGIQTGDFGLRLYFYSAMGEYLTMYGGIAVRGASPEDWEVAEIAFGRGTNCPIPPGAATMMVRFSMWAQDGASGTAWLDDVSLEKVGEEARIVRTKPLAWVWQDESLGKSPANLSDAVSEGGFDVLPKSTAELLSPDGVRGRDVDLLVLPYGGRYPTALAEPILDFCRDGGALLLWGGPPFTRPVYQTAAGPRELTAGTQVLASLPSGDEWTEQHAGDGDRLVAKPGSKSRDLSIDLKAYAYAGTAMPPLATPDVVLELEAKGDGKTPRVCIELHEADGSRWKRILPLSPDWTAHRFHLAEFAAYASKDRGGKGDVLHGDRLKQFMVGLTRQMVGQGEHRFELRNVRFLKADVPSGMVVGQKRFLPEDLTVTRWFGDTHTVEPNVIPAPTGTFGPSETRSRLRCPANGSVAKGHWRVWQLGTPISAKVNKEGKRRSLDRVLAAEGASLRVPLLQAENRFGGELACGVLDVHKDGAFAGSRWATFAVATPGDLPLPAMTAVTEAAKDVATGAWTQGPDPTFRVQDGKVVVDVGLPVANPALAECRMKVALRVGDAQPVVRDLVVPARDAVPSMHPLAEGLPVPNLADEPLVLRVQVLKSSGPLFGPRVFELDLRKELRDVCDFMVEQARDDGKLHGFSFIDNRGMRALLGAYEILGDRRYLKTALRWGEAMVAEQRDDGGYRMGYGITRKGEECYVADGGEIVVGVLRLASYAKGRQRQRFLASADRYMAYRESFRVPTGGIGVGWCLYDYGQRPVTKLDTPTKIFAPERNTYTIGCSLAGAYAHAAMHGDPALERRAEKDADWLIPRASRLNGAFIESFFFAHAFATSPERKRIYADYIDRVFTQTMVGGYSNMAWWLQGGGRTALNLDGLAYVLHRLGGGPEVRAEMYRALCAMYSPQAPYSIPVVISKGEFDHDRWIYVNFGTLGLVDVLRPMVSIDGVVPKK
jgi:hypothetical protein